VFTVKPWRPIVAFTCLITFVCLATACSRRSAALLTISGSAVGREGDVLRRQLERFRQANPDIAVALRPTPDAADLRHQLYVQWLNARVSDPDVLQLDVVWTPEFAAAGWISPLDAFRPPVEDFFASAVHAHRWNGSLYALPWFIDVGMLYWRTDLAQHPPRTLAELRRTALDAKAMGAAQFGMVLQAARYEGLITVFVEHLGAFGGGILDERGQVTVDSDAAVQALTWMRDAIYVDDLVPAAALAWQEEQTRFAFQNGQAVFMRNWPYAFSLLSDPSQSSVAGRFAVSTFPGRSADTATAALGGSALAINAHSEQPEQAYRLVEFLLRPQQMLERAEIAGQLPPRVVMYDSQELARAIPVDPRAAKQIIERAVPRPVTPVYSELSAILQVSVHRALTRQQEPRAALESAATEMRALLTRVKLTRP